MELDCLDDAALVVRGRLFCLESLSELAEDDDFSQDMAICGRHKMTETTATVRGRARTTERVRVLLAKIRQFESSQLELYHDGLLGWQA